jgi:hypothetical protein
VALDEGRTVMQPLTLHCATVIRFMHRDSL